MLRALRLAIIIPAICLLGCAFEITTPESFLPVGSSFVVKGTATLADNNGPCLVWIGDNGITYHLFQNPRVDNEMFDQVTTPGTTSRLQLAKRSDLEVSCQIGTIVEVQAILEILN